MPRSASPDTSRVGRRRIARAAQWLALIVFAATGLMPARAAEPAVAFDGGDQSISLLGPGTGVIVGIVDSGVDSTHPLLAGNDSLGHPRLVAQANFVSYEPSNTGADVYGHGTAVAGIILGHGDVDSVNYDGMAPDARYVNARVLDSSNGFSGTAQVMNGVQFALANHADVINLSLALGSTESDGLTQLDLMVDYIVDTRGVLVTVAGGNNGNGLPSHGPGAARNGLTVGALSTDYSRVATFSDSGLTSDGRIKPDIVAPGSVVSSANLNWQTGPLVTNFSGTSFSAPQAAGLAAQMIDYGRANNLSVDTRVLRAVIMNAADTTLDSNGAAWSHSATQPMDLQQGTGRLDAVNAAHQYIAGQFNPGTVPNEGWALHTILGASTPTTTSELYSFAQTPTIGSYIDATLLWNQHVVWNDSGTLGVIDPSDFFTLDPNNPQDNLNLYLYRDGVLVDSSTTSVDTVEHIHFLVNQAGQYDLRVTRASGPDAGETYALAWNSVAVPEPAAWAIMAFGAAWLPLARRRNRRVRIMEC